MTQNVDTTKKFILENRGYLKLAFMVAKAVPLIRDEAVEKILTHVAKDLKQQFEKGPDSDHWKVDFFRSQAVRIKKCSWQCGGGKGWPDWEGIRLDRDWNGANISVSLITNVEHSEIGKFCHEQNIGAPRMRGSYLYCGLEGHLKDWNEADFVRDALDDPKGIAADLAKKMRSLAREIDRILAK